MTLNLKNCSVKDLFYEIQRQTDLFFVYNLRNFENVGTINVKAKNEEVDKVLARVFEGRDVEFLFEDNTVVVRPMPLQQQQVQERKVTGVVKDEQGNVLPGVAIVIKGTTMGTSTDADGKYSLISPESGWVTSSSRSVSSDGVAGSEDGVSTGMGKKSENEHPMNIRMAMIDMTATIFFFITSPFESCTLRILMEEKRQHKVL